MIIYRFQRLNKNNSLVFEFEGLNSVKYQVVEVLKTALYTKIIVYYNETEILNTKFKIWISTSFNNFSTWNMEMFTIPQETKDIWKNFS